MDGQLKQISKELSAEQSVKVTGGLNLSQTQSKIQKQLDTISKNLKVSVNLDTVSMKQQTEAINKQLSSGIHATKVKVPFQFDLSDSKAVEAEINKIVAKISGNKGNLIKYKINVDDSGMATSALLTYRNELNEVTKATLKLQNAGSWKDKNGVTHNVVRWAEGQKTLSQNIEATVKANQRQIASDNQVIRKKEELIAQMKLLKTQAEKSGLSLNVKNQDAFNDLSINASTKEDIEQLESYLRLARTEYQTFNAEISKGTHASSIEAMKNTLASMPNDIALLEARFNSIKAPDAVKGQIEQLKKDIQSIDAISDPTQKIAKYNQIVATLQRLQKQYQVTAQEQKNLNADFATMQGAQTLRSNMISWIEENRDAAIKYDAVLKQILIDSQNLGGKTDLTKLEQQFRAVKATIEATEASTRGFFGNMKIQLKEAFVNTVRYQSAYRIIMETTQALRSMIQAVRDLDTSLTEFNKVSDLSTDQLAEFSDKAFDSATAIGRTGKDMIDAATEFRRAGYELDSSLDMGNAALIMTNVADGIDDTSDAAGTLISVLKGFNMSETDIMSVVDKMNSVSNQSPIGFDNIAEGLRRASGTMYQAGNTIDETIGLITGGFAQLRNVEKVSTGLITISQRLRGIGEDGEAIEGLSASMQKSFGSIGVNIEDENGDLRSTYDIIRDYANVFPELTTKQKQFYGELASGKRQVNVWNAIVQQIGDVDKAIEQSIDSVGSAERENEIFRQSVQGLTNEFNNAFQTLSAEISTEWVKDFISAGTDFLHTLTNIVEQETLVSGTIGLVAEGARDLAAVLRELSEDDTMGYLIKAFLTYQTISKGMDLFSFVKDKYNSTKSMNKFFQAIMGGGEVLKNLGSDLDETGAKATKTTASFANLTKGIGGMLALALALEVGMKIFDHLNVTLEEQQQKVEGITSKLESLNEEYNTILQNNTGSGADLSKLSSLERQIELNERILAQEKEKLAMSTLWGKGSFTETGQLQSVALSDTDEAQLQRRIDKLYQTRVNFSNFESGLGGKDPMDYFMGQEYTRQEEKLIEQLRKDAADIDTRLKNAYASRDLVQAQLDSGALDNNADAKARAENNLEYYNNQIKELEGYSDRINIAITVNGENISAEVEDVVDEAQSQADEQPITLQAEITGLDKMSSGMDALSKIYDDVADGGTFDFGSLVDGDFVEIFGQYEEAYDKFLKTVSEAPNDIKACQNAFNELASELIYSNEQMQEVTEENYDMTVAFLKSKGVINANEVANYALAQSQARTWLASQDLVNITQDQINKFVEENATIGVTKEMMYLLQLQMIQANETGLDFSQQIAELQELAINAGVAADAQDALNQGLSGRKAARAAERSGMSTVDYVVSQLQSKISAVKPTVNIDPSSTTKDSGSSKDPYVAEVDKYKTLKDAVAEVEEQIESLDQQYEHTDNVEKQISLKNQIIALYQKEQDALTALNNARDKEIASNVADLRSKGFQIDYNPETDRLNIKNREHINDLDQSIIEKYDDMIKATDELNDANKESAKQWTELSYAIVDARKELTELRIQMYEDTVRDKEHLIELFGNRTSALGKDISIYESLMKDALKTWIDLVQRGYDENKEAIQDLEKDWMDYYDKRIEAEKKVLEQQLDDHDSALDGVIFFIDKQIEGLNDQIDALKEVNEERRESLELQKAQAALDRARNQKVRKVLRKGQGFIYEADEDAIRDAEEDLADKQYEASVNKLEKQKEELEELKNIWEEIPDLYQRYQNELLAYEKLGNEWQEELLSDGIDLYEKFKDDYISIQEQIQAKTDETEKHLSGNYNAMMELFRKMADLAGTSPTSTSTGSRSWNVGKDGKAPSQAQVGDTIYTNGGTYRITGKDANGKFTSTKIDDVNSHITDGMWGMQVDGYDDVEDALYTNAKYTNDNADVVKDNTKATENQISASDVLAKLTSTGNALTQDEILTLIDNMDYIDENTVRIDDNTYAIEDLIRALQNFEVKVEIEEPEEEKVKEDKPFDDSIMSKADQDWVDQLQVAWNLAKEQGNTSLMDQLHAAAEAVRDQYRGGAELADVNLYENSEYQVTSVKQTGGGSASTGNVSALEKEYKWIQSKADWSDEYSAKLDAAIAREQYGSGHTITTLTDQYGRTYTEITPTNSAEGNMSADEIRNNANSTNKNTDSVDRNSDIVRDAGDNVAYAGDTIADAADSMSKSVSDAANTIAESAKTITTTKTYTQVGGSGGKAITVETVDGIKYGSIVTVDDSPSGSGGNSGDKGSGSTVTGSGFTTKKTYKSVSKKAKGGLNLAEDIYNVNEKGDEMLIQPEEGNWVSLNAGSSVLPHEVAEVLWKFGGNPEGFFEEYYSAIQPQTQSFDASLWMQKQQMKLDKGNMICSSSNSHSEVNNYNIDRIELPNVRDYQDFIGNWHTLENRAKQFVGKK